MAVDLSLTSTYLWDTDISNLTPMKNHIIVELNEEEMLRIGNTNLIMGYFEENRNNAHWFGNVVSVGLDVPLNVRDKVWFSYLSAKGMDRIVSHKKLFIFLNFRDVILRYDGEIEMMNGYILSTPLPPKKISSLEVYETDTFYTQVRHVPKNSLYKDGDIVHYWLEQVYELEGDNKLLKENYRVIQEEHILALVDQEEVFKDGMVLVQFYQEELELKSGIKLTAPVKKAKLVKGKVMKSTCAIPTNEDVYVRKSKGYKMGDYFLFLEEHVEAIC